MIEGPSFYPFGTSEPRHMHRRCLREVPDTGRGSSMEKQGLSEVRAVKPVGRIGGVGLRLQVKVTRFAGSPSLLDPLPSPYPLTLSFRVLWRLIVCVRLSLSSATLSD